MRLPRWLLDLMEILDLDIVERVEWVRQWVQTQEAIGLSNWQTSDGEKRLYDQLFLEGSSQSSIQLYR